MKTASLALLAALAATASSQSSAGASNTQARFVEVPFTEVKIEDSFWAPRRAANRKVSIPHVLQMCRDTPRIRNLQRAGSGATSGFAGLVFDDSDVYKALESAAYALAEKHEPSLDKQVDELIAIIAKAQRPNGYLNSYYQLHPELVPFSNLADNHELYCAGHLFEAAVAHYRATGKKTLLNVATRFADLLVATFGPEKRMGYPGHPEIELALMKLWRATGNSRYYDLVRFFIENRGTGFFAQERRANPTTFDGTYWLDDCRIRDHHEIKGHAVRAAYLFSGVADYAAVVADPGLDKMLERVWRNAVEKRTFVTGGIGPSASNEGFTTDYDLPNLSAYQETCASIAMALWNHRMGLLNGNAKYWDHVERALYNGMLAGISLKGDTFFYVNPLASQGNHHRTPWFGCACCPPNVTRTLASLGQYLYAKSGNRLYVNLFVAGSVKTELDGKPLQLDVSSRFPWEGAVAFRPKLTAARKFAICLRVPSWAGKAARASLGGKPVGAMQNGYLVVDRTWNPGDTLRFDLPMQAQRIVAHPGVKDDAGLAALQRGPLVYCLEQQDQKAPISDLYLPVDAPLGAKFEPALLGGITVLEGTARIAQTPSWRRTLYQPLPAPKPAAIRAIPYYAWDNRKPGAMEVWLPVAPKAATVGGLESEAKVTASYLAGISTQNAIRDGKSIEASNKHPGQLFHFWPHKGTSEWVQYTWTQPQSVSGVKVYWFDDTGFGECRPPASWEVQALVNGAWKPVSATTPYATDLNKFVEVKFAPVKTKALRLVMKLQDKWAVGIHEWQVVEADE